MTSFGIANNLAKGLSWCFFSKSTNGSTFNKLSPFDLPAGAKVQQPQQDMRASHHTSRLKSAFNWVKNKMPVFYVKHEIEESVKFMNSVCSISQKQLNKDTFLANATPDERALLSVQNKLSRLECEFKKLGRLLDINVPEQPSSDAVNPYRNFSSERISQEIRLFDDKIKSFEKCLNFFQKEMTGVFNTAFDLISFNDSAPEGGMAKQLDAIETHIDDLVRRIPSLAHLGLSHETSKQKFVERIHTIELKLSKILDQHRIPMSFNDLEAEIFHIQDGLVILNEQMKHALVKMSEIKNESLYLQKMLELNRGHNPETFFKIEFPQEHRHKIAFNKYGRYCPGSIGIVRYSEIENKINSILVSRAGRQFTNKEDAVKYAQQKVFSDYFQTSVQVKTVALGLGMVAAGTGVGATAAVVGGAIGGAAGTGAAVALYGFTHLATKPMKQNLKEFISQSQISMRDLPSGPDDSESRNIRDLNKELGKHDRFSWPRRSSLSSDSEKSFERKLDHRVSDVQNYSGSQNKLGSPTSVYSETFEPLPNAIKDHEFVPRPLNIRTEISKDQKNPSQEMSGALQILPSSVYTPNPSDMLDMLPATQFQSKNRLHTTEATQGILRTNSSKNANKSVRFADEEDKVSLKNDVLNSDSMTFKNPKEQTFEFLDPAEVPNIADRSEHFEAQLKSGSVPAKDLFKAYSEFWRLENEYKNKINNNSINSIL